MLDLEDDLELYDEWFNDDERLTPFRKSREQFLGKVKVSDLQYVQEHQCY